MNRAAGLRAGEVRDRRGRRANRRMASRHGRRPVASASPVSRCSGESIRTNGSKAAATSCCACSTRACCAGTSPRSRSSAGPAAGRGCATPCGMEPRSLLARFMSKFEIGVRTSAGSIAVYRRLDRVLAAGRKPEIDPIDPEVAVPDRGARAPRRRPRPAREASPSERAADALIAYLAHAIGSGRRADPAARARRRSSACPRTRSSMRACTPRTSACSTMVWDVICPSCRIPSSVVDSLAKIEEHGTCKACELGYQVDFAARSSSRFARRRRFARSRPGRTASAVRRTSRTSPRRCACSRTSGSRSRCRSRPATTSCAARSCRARTSCASPRPAACGASTSRSASASTLPALTAGDQLLTVVNQEAREVVVRVERAGDRAFALTASRVASQRDVPRAVSGSGARARPADGGHAGDARRRAARRRAAAVSRARRCARVSARAAVLRESRRRSRRSTAAR